jgi:hypothetical protein
MIVDDNTAQVEMIVGRDFLKENNVTNLKIDHDTVNERVKDTKYDINLMDEIYSSQSDLYSIFTDVKPKIDNLDIADNDETNCFKKDVENIFLKYYLLYERPDEPDVTLTADIRLIENKVVTVTPQRLSEVERKKIKCNY